MDLRIAFGSLGRIAVGKAVVEGVRRIVAEEAGRKYGLVEAGVVEVEVVFYLAAVVGDNLRDLRTAVVEQKLAAGNFEAGDLVTTLLLVVVGMLGGVSILGYSVEQDTYILMAAVLHVCCPAVLVEISFNDQNLELVAYQDSIRHWNHSGRPGLVEEGTTFPLDL